MTMDARLHVLGEGDGTAIGGVDADAPPVRVRTSRYTDPAFAALEVRSMWPRVWQVACSADHVAGPGDFFEYRVGPYAVLVVRDGDGGLGAFVNACRHRGNSLCTGAGSGLSELRCGYHGWTWDLQGRLKRVPGRKGFGRLSLSELPLLPARAEQWGPLVFVSPDVDAVPLVEWLEEVPGDVAWARLEDFRCTAALTGEVPANWKTVADGFSETYHIATLHPELLRCVDDVAAPQRVFGRTSVSEQEYGVASPRFGGELKDAEVWEAFCTTQGSRMGLPSGSVPPPVPVVGAGSTLQDAIAGLIREHHASRGVDLGGFTTREVMRLRQYNLFPNATVLATADTLSVLTARPGPSPARAEMTIYAFTRAAPGAPRTRPVDMRVAFEDLDLGYVLNQDAAVIGGLQRGISQPALTHIVLSQEEKRVVNTHRNLEQYLGIRPDD